VRLIDFAVMPREPRLVFGEVAEVYDRVRPSYPTALVDDVVKLAGVGAGAGAGAANGRGALEVGAGTGKATVMFAQRGVAVHALEPSPAMAAIARRRCARYEAVTIEETDFEHWRPPVPRFAPELRYARARAALRDGGLLAVFWSRPHWERCALRDELRAVYERSVPDFGPDPGPMHPGSEIAPDRWEDWEAEIAGSEGLERPEVRVYKWSCGYTAEHYVQLLGTSQDHILLSVERRHALLRAVQEVVERNGGTVTMPFVTKLCLAHG
jgi:SAM-dependent methyltransferase